MPNPLLHTSNRLLDPIERISEILFGLIMVLTFTGSLSAASAGREEVRTMLISAVGCNLAWGLVDAVMYLIGQLVQTGRGLLTLRAVRACRDAEQAHRLMRSVLPPAVGSVLKHEELETLRGRLGELPEPPPARLTKVHYMGALAVFLFVFVSTFPVVIPFIVFHDATRAMRVSNGVAIFLLFLCGFRLGHYADHRPWRMGFLMAIVGSVLVAITIALGG